MARTTHARTHPPSELALAGLLGVCLALLVGCGEHAWAELGEARHALQNQGTETLVATDVSDPSNPSLAWIPAANASIGYMLLTWHTRNGAGWSWGHTYIASTPVWDAEHYWDDATDGFPEPDNFCDLYICTGMTPDQIVAYERPRAIATGLANIAAIVSEVVVEDAATDQYRDIAVHVVRLDKDAGDAADEVVFLGGHIVSTSCASTKTQATQRTRWSSWEATSCPSPTPACSSRRTPCTCLSPRTGPC